MSVVEFAESGAVVDGFAHDNHGCKGEFVFGYYIGEVFELSSEYLLVFPREFVASGDRSFRWVSPFDEFVLNLLRQ